MGKIKLKEIKVDPALTPQTASQKGLGWVKDTIFSPQAPIASRDVIKLINEGYCLGRPNLTNASKVLVGLYRSNLMSKRKKDEYK